MTGKKKWFKVSKHGDCIELVIETESFTISNPQEAKDLALELLKASGWRLEQAADKSSQREARHAAMQQNNVNDSSQMLGKAGAVLATNGRCPRCAVRGLLFDNLQYDTNSKVSARAYCENCKKHFVLTYSLAHSQEVPS